MQQLRNDFYLFFWNKYQKNSVTSKHHKGTKIQKLHKSQK